MYARLLLCLLIIGSQGWSAVRAENEEGEGCPRCQIGPRDISIWNSTEYEVMLYLRNDGSTWVEFTLAPDDDQTYTDCDSTEIEVITIEQDGTETVAKYALDLGKHYQIYWNENLARNDVALVEPR